MLDTEVVVDQAPMVDEMLFAPMRQMMAAAVGYSVAGKMKNLAPTVDDLGLTPRVARRKCCC